jgi:hypothetical protein
MWCVLSCCPNPPSSSLANDPHRFPFSLSLPALDQFSSSLSRSRYGRLNGGPGCSSSTGLLFELGPCAVAHDGANTTWNKYSWTESANMIFLDSPVQVGYSYGGKTINNSQDTAKDSTWLLFRCLGAAEAESEFPCLCSLCFYAALCVPYIMSSRREIGS